MTKICLSEIKINNLLSSIYSHRSSRNCCRLAVSLISSVSFHTPLCCWDSLFRMNRPITAWFTICFVNNSIFGFVHFLPVLLPLVPLCALSYFYIRLMYHRFRVDKCTVGGEWLAAHRHFSVLPPMGSNVPTKCSLNLENVTSWVLRAVLSWNYRWLETPSESSVRFLSAIVMFIFIVRNWWGTSISQNHRCSLKPSQSYKYSASTEQHQTVCSSMCSLLSKVSLSPHYRLFHVVVCLWTPAVGDGQRWLRRAWTAYKTWVL